MVISPREERRFPIIWVTVRLASSRSVIAFSSASDCSSTLMRVVFMDAEPNKSAERSTSFCSFWFVQASERFCNSPSVCSVHMIRIACLHRDAVFHQSVAVFGGYATLPVIIQEEIPREPVSVKRFAHGLFVPEQTFAVPLDRRYRRQRFHNRVRRRR